MVITSLLLILLASCNPRDGDHYIPKSSKSRDSAPIIAPADSTKIEKARAWNYADSLETQFINTHRTKADQLVDFAETLKGITYKYGSVDPGSGFDCSGFISYVFNHFGISVPRSSKDFTSVEREISLKQAKRGDIILFTGTDSTKRVVGHMGIITSPEGQNHEFIHSTSGKAYGVTITPLNKYYQGRFVKVIRIFRDNDL